MSDAYSEYLQESVDRCKARRARVLAHPEISVRLTKPPFRYKHPEQWSGYIPPKMVERQGALVENDNAQRKALIEICQAVVDSERAPTDQPTHEPDPNMLGPSVPGSAVAKQLQHVHILFGNAGITDRDNKLAFMTEVTGRPITTSRDLSRLEAARVMGAINRIIHPPGDETA